MSADLSIDPSWPVDEPVVGVERHNERVPLLPSYESPLVGRATELAQLRSRTFDSDAGTSNLIGGDAGVGKTRLITTLMHETVEAGARVLLGHCLDLGDSSAPYLPFAEMFARLAQEEHELVLELVRDRPLLAPLLPEYYRREVRTDLPTDRGSFFDAVHMSLEQLGEQSPVVVVVEDAHWADRSTRELLTFLFTRGFGSHVSLVVSFRSDDLNRRHPLRSKLAEWSRLPGMRRVMLQPLNDDEVAELVRGLNPQTSRSDATTIVARAGGNPFFAEELLAASRVGDCGLPGELADLLLVRIDALDASARSVVRAASVSGRSIDHTLLRAVVDLPDGELDQALRDLVDDHVFEITSSGDYTFRHALLGEAVYDDLLPGERVNLHGRFAEALREQTDAAPVAALARHARVAGKHELALDASVRAGDAAMAARGPADASRHYENALTQLAERPQPGRSVLALATKTLEALVASGNPQRAAEIAAQALDGVGGDEEERAMLVAHLLSAQLLSDHSMPSVDLLRATIDARRELPPTPATAALYASLGRALFFLDDFEGSLLAANQATVLARELDLPTVATDALTTLARLDEFVGDPADAERQLRDLVTRARAAGHGREEVRAMHQLGRVQGGRSNYEQAYRTYQETVARAHAGGLDTDPFAIEARTLGALYGLMHGDADGVDRLLDLGELQLPGLAQASMTTVRMVRDAQRADGDPLAALPRVRPMWRRDMFTCIHSSAVAIDRLGRDGDLEAMLEVYDEAVETFTTVWSLPLFDGRIRLSALAIGHLADHPDESYRDRVDALLQAAQDVAATRPREQLLGLESRAWLQRARADHARFAWGGRGPVPAELLSAWRETLDTFVEHGEPYETARAQLTHAALLAAAGDRDAARALQDQARATARRIGATVLVADSRRAPATASTGLTPREQEVLALVTDGRTNGEIAKELFISTKTASVHVSNILAKLGAATRTEAAAIARRDELV